MVVPAGRSFGSSAYRSSSFHELGSTSHTVVASSAQADNTWSRSSASSSGIATSTALVTASVVFSG